MIKFDRVQYESSFLTLEYTLNFDRPRRASILLCHPDEDLRALTGCARSSHSQYDHVRVSPSSHARASNVLAGRQPPGAQLSADRRGRRSPAPPPIRAPPLPKPEPFHQSRTLWRSVRPYGARSMGQGRSSSRPLDRVRPSLHIGVYPVEAKLTLIRPSLRSSVGFARTSQSCARWPRAGSTTASCIVSRPDPAAAGNHPLRPS